MPEPAILAGVRRYFAERGIEVQQVILADDANWGGFCYLVVEADGVKLGLEVESYHRDDAETGYALALLFADRLERERREHPGPRLSRGLLA